VRGKAYLQMKDADKAIAEFGRIAQNQSWRPTSPLWPMAQLELARAWAMKGDTAKAKAGYQDFFALWKDADGDAAVLAEAKGEYGKLR
jgi:eukaryotic-like serine/threonine-protein kinase